MDKVYVLTSGIYSNYRIVGIFSTRAMADKFRAAVPESDYNETEVHQLDSDAPDLIRRGYSLYHVTMLRDGTTERVERQEVGAYIVGEAAKEPRVWRRTRAAYYKDKGVPDALTATVWAKSDEAAIKIVNEKRAQMIAAGKWDKGTTNGS